MGKMNSRAELCLGKAKLRKFLDILHPSPRSQISFGNARPALLAALLLTLGLQGAQAQQTISYTNGQTNSGTITITGSLNATTLSITSGAATQSGVISESGTVGAIIKTGAGALTLTTANSYTGTTSIVAGILEADASGALGTGAVTVNAGATLALGNGSAVTLGNDLTISGTGTAGQGAISIVAGGPIVVIHTLNGTVTLAADASIGNPGSSSGHVLNLHSVVLSSHTLTLGGGGPSPIYTGGNISGTGGLIVAANSQVYFNYSGSNTFTGTTDVLSGADVTLNNFGGTSISGDLTIESGATVEDDRSGQLSANTTLRLNGSGEFDFDAPNVTATIAGLTGTSSNSLVVVEQYSTATLTLSGTGTYAYAGRLTDNTTTYNSTLNLVKSGTGTQTLSGNDNYNGSTTISAGTLAIGAGGNIATSSGVILSGTATFDITAANQTIKDLAGVSGTVTLGSRALTLGTANSSTFAGNIIGAGGSLVKTGTGTLTLGGTNTYTGGTTVNGGTLQALGRNSLGNSASPFTLNGATLQADAKVQIDGVVTLGANGGVLNADGNSIILTGHITGSGSLTIIATGGAQVDMDNSADSNYTGLTTVQQGRLALNSGTGHITVPGDILIDAAGILQTGYDQQIAATSTVTDDGTFVFSNFTATPSLSQTIGVLLGTGVINNNVTTTTATLTISSGNFSGKIQNTAGQITLVKQGTGTLVLSGTNTYTGGATITAGTLALGAAGSIATSSGVNLSGTSTFDITAGSQTIKDLAGLSGTVSLGSSTLTLGTANSTTFAGTVTGSGGGLTKVGAGTLTLSGTNTYSGGTTISSGTLQVSNDVNLGNASGSVTLNGGTLAMNATNLITHRTINLAGAGGTITTVGNPQINLEGLITGSGTLILDHTTPGGIITIQGTVDNTFTGLTTIQGGLVTLASFGHVALSGDVLITASGRLYDETSEQISSTGTVTNNGNFRFSTSTNAQQTIGTLLGNGQITGGLAGADTLIVGAGNFSGKISDGTAPIALVKQGAGTLILSGTSTYSGATSINAGTLLINGSTFSAGTVSVGTGSTLGGTGSTGIVTVAGGGNINLHDNLIGTLTVGGLTLGSSGTPSALSFDINTTGSLTTMDKIVDSGTLTLGGPGGTTIAIGKLSGSSTLTSGTYDLLTYSGTQVDLSGLNLLTTSLDGYVLSLVQSGTTISLVVAPPIISTTYDLGTSVTDPRVISGGTTTVGATITNTGTGTADSLDFTGLTTTGSVSGGGLPLSGGPLANGGSTATGTGTLSVGTTTGNTTVTATVTSVTNTNLSTSSTLGATISGTVDVVDNRTVTASAVDLGRVMINTAISGTSTLGTTGDNLHFTSVTVGNAGPDANGISTTGTTGTVFDSAAVTSTRTLSGTFGTTGNASGTFTLLTTGEGLTGEVPINVALGYVADAVANRIVTATTVDLGRVMVGVGVSGTSTLSTTGADVDFTRVTVGNTGPDANGISTLGGTSTVFNNASVTDTRSLSGTFSTAGTTGGTFTLVTTGEGLTGEAPINVALAYTADAVNKRVITDGATTDLGVLHNGATLSGTTTAFTTTGTLDTTTSVSVAAGSGTADANGVVLGGGPTSFTGTTFSDSRTLSGTIVNATGGTTSGTFALAVTTLENGGTGLTGEGVYGNVSSAYTAFVYNGQGVWNTNGSGSWGAVSATPANWTANGGTPGLDGNFTTTDSAVFGAVLTGGTALVTLDGANPSLNAITFNNGAASYVIMQGTGGSLTLNGGAGNAVVTNLSGTHTISAPVVLATSADVSVASGQQLTFSGPISGGGGFNNTGAGTTILTGANSYGGGTTISAGILQGNATSLQGTILNNASLVFDQVGNGTFAGAISGNGSVTKQNGGTLALVGANSYAGGTILTGGALALGNSGALGSGALTTGNATVVYANNVSIANVITMTGATTLEVDNADTAQQSGVISETGGSQALTKLGTGSLVLNAANTYSGGTTISAGNLVIANPAALGTGSVINNGTLLATLSNHLINIGGDYTQGAGGTLQLNLVSSMVYDSVHLTSSTGVAHLNGTLALNLAGSFAPGAGQQFVLVATNNPVDGTFSSVTTNLPSIGGVIDYTNNVTVIYQKPFATLAGMTLTPNQASIANYLDAHDQHISNPAFATLIGALNNASGTPQSLVSAFNQLTPLNFASFTSNTTFNNATFSVQQFDSYLANHRGADGTFVAGANGPDFSGLAYNDPLVDPSLQALRGRLLAWSPEASPGLLSDSGNAVLSGADMATNRTWLSPKQKPWNVYVTGNVVLGQGFSNPTAGLSYNSSTTGAVTAGADYKITSHWLVGAAFGYGHTNATLDTIGSNASVNTYSPAVYTSYSDNGWYTNGLASYGFANYNQNRNVAIGAFTGTANSSPGGDQIIGDIDGGYDFHRGNWTFGPTLGLQYAHLDMDGYTESGLPGANLTVASNQADSLRSLLGGRVNYTIKTASLIFTPHFSASWQHEYLNQSRGITSQFNGLGAGSFVVNTPSASSNSGLADLGLDTQINDALTGFVDYSVQAGQSNYFGQSVQAGFKIGF